MSSNTKMTRRRRKRKKANQGKTRKRLARSRGTTPPFPIHPES